MKHSKIMFKPKAASLPVLIGCFFFASGCLAISQTAPRGPVRSVAKYALTSTHDYSLHDPKNWRLLGSNDHGLSWDVLDVETNQTFASRNERRVFVLPHVAAYNTYRLVVDAAFSRARSNDFSVDWSVQLTELELIGPPDAPAEEADLHGTVTASKAHPLMGPPENAFDDDKTTRWMDFGLGTPGGCWIQCEYTRRRTLQISSLSQLRIAAKNAARDAVLEQSSQILSNLAAYADKPLRTIRGYALVSANDSPERDPRDWRLLGSNNGGKSWDLLDVRRNEIFNLRFQKRMFSLTNEVAYVLYRLEVDATAGKGQGLQIGEIEPLYPAKDGGRFSVVVSAKADNPPMESAEMAFDGDPKTKWFCFPDTVASQPVWFQWQYIPEVEGLPAINMARLERLTDKTPSIITNLAAEAAASVRKLTGYALTSANDAPSRDPRDWRLLGSKDEGKTWDTLDVRTNETFTSRAEKRAFTLANAASYALYRLEIDSVADPVRANSVQLAELEPLYAAGGSNNVAYSIVISARGENPPMESADNLFDGRSESKWLDFVPGNTNRATWIEWRYVPRQETAVINLDRVHTSQAWMPQPMRLNLEGIVVSDLSPSNRLGLLNSTGFQWFELDPPIAGVRLGDHVRLSGRLRFKMDAPTVLQPQIVSLHSIPSVPEIKPGQPLDENQSFFETVAEGRALALSQNQYYTTIQLVDENETNRIFANILHPRQVPIPPSLNCRLRVRGVVEPVFDENGRRVAGVIWVADLNDVGMAEPTEKEWSVWPEYSAEELAQTDIPSLTLVRVQGALLQQNPGESFVIGQGTNHVIAYSKQLFSAPPGVTIEAAGFFERKKGRSVLYLACVRVAEPDASATVPSVAEVPQFDDQHPATDIRQIRQLMKDRPRAKFPIKVRGVITYIDLGLAYFFLQDGPDGILINSPMGAGLYPMLRQEGAYVELQGMVVGKGDIYPTAFVSALGKGRMPEARKHSWDYLMSGADDGQWVQQEGVISAFEKQRLTLNVPGGQLVVWINEIDKPLQDRLLGSEVRVSGVCDPVVNSRDQRLGLRLLVPSSEYVEVVNAPPANPFDLPTTPIHNVTESTPDGTRQMIQLIKTAGVLTYRGPHQFFIQDGKDGLRVFSRQEADVQPGDRVEVVGLAEPDGFSPKLTQALVRKMEPASLPSAKPIDLLGTDLDSRDSTRASIVATFLGQSSQESVQVLEFRHEKTKKTFSAFLPDGHGPLAAIPVGSRVVIEGVFKARADNVPDFGQVISSFEMYLNSPADISVLERPPWWTTRHTLWLLGGLASVLLVSLAWAGLLRKKVRRRTRELKDEIDERRRAEDALRESQVVYHSLVEHLPACVYRQDSEGRFVFVNARFCQFKGLGLEEIIGRTPQEIGGRGAKARFMSEDLSILQTGKSVELEEELRELGGKIRHFQIVKSPVFSADGKVVGVQGMFFDITQRKQAEAELACERDLLGTLMENSPDYIYFKDAQSRFIRCSRVMGERFGAGPEGIVGRYDFDFYSGDHAHPAYNDEQEIIRTGQPLIGKIEKEVWKDGRETWVLTSKMPLRNKANEIIGTFGISKDITAIKAAEARLEDAHRQLLESSRLAGMAEVATSVLHNVGNVLNSVNVSSSLVAERVRHSKGANLAKVVELMQEHAADLPGFFAHDPKGRQLPAYLGTLAERLAGEQKEMLQELALLGKNIEHIKEIVAMQQSYARVSGVLESLSVVDLAEDALRMNAGAMERHQVRLVREYGEVPPILVDKHKVLQILVNLIRNAKYALDEKNNGDKQITLRVGMNGSGMVKVSVVDNGVGIPRENLTRIFEHGFTTRREGHGFGLHSGALAAKEMGGSLHVHSDGAGLGATFTLELPCRTGRLESHE